MASWFSKIEKKWQKLWSKAGVFEPDIKRAKRPFYNLMMFPYPSAEGLHVGNMYAFVGSDIYGRFKRMQGYDVFEPMGLDGFGIHSENYALQVGRHPAKQAKISEKNFYRQLRMIGNGFSWKEKLETYDPEYYKWTQWIFVQMFKNGLAYRKKQAVNWCPDCRTVLADEQVVSGECERCESKVIKKELEQWFFKITNYAERLLQDLGKIDWSEKVKIAQRNWIGRSEGVTIRSRVKDLGIEFEVFDSVPQTFMAQTFTVIAPEHPLVPQLVRGTKFGKPVLKFIEDIKNRKARGEHLTDAEPEGIFTGRYTDNPFGTGDLPIWVASYAVLEYGSGIVHCSAHDERDFAFAKKYKIPLRPVMFPKNFELAQKVRNLEIAYVKDSEGILEQPREFAGRKWGEMRNDIIAFLEKKGIATRAVNYRLRDWLISRQRYWGPPIPMIFCEKCGWQPVPEKDLPVKLPYLKDWRPKGKGVSPLATQPKFYKVKCPRCKGPARRETDVSDTFLDSAWYFFRYLDVKNKREIFSEQIAKRWLPVDMYIGGAEHSVLHLLYVRFITKVFKEWELINFNEPFPKFRAHGLLIKDGAKMSKSRGNVVNPDAYIKKFGADALRMYLMFLGPFDQGGDFRDSGILGITRFLNRVRNLKYNANLRIDANATNIERILYQSIKKVTEDIENLRYNTAISQLMILLNAFEKYGVERMAYGVFLKLLAPFAPYISEELWQNSKFKIQNSKIRKQDSIHLQSWPKYDAKKIKEDTFDLVVQINGRVRATLKAAVGISQGEAEKLAKSNENVKKFLAGTPKKVIFVPNKLINFVV